MQISRTCKSTGFVSSATITTKNAYLTGVMLDIGKGNATIEISDGKGALILYLTLTLATQGVTRRVEFPSPVRCDKGIVVKMTGLGAFCIVFYQEY